MVSKRIAVDAMGGDHAPYEIIRGSLRFAKRNPAAHILLFGEEAPLKQAWAKLSNPKMKNVELHFCGESVTMDESPVQALRHKQDSSISKAVEAVANGDADAFFSAGNTGVCVAATTLRWRLLPGISRAGISIPFPSHRGVTLALDMGANLTCRPEHLFGFALMGSIYSQNIYGVRNPRIALLNVGSEENKGTKILSETRDIIRDSNLNFTGYIEGNHIFESVADVLVCDGFVGNVILKTAEGVTSFIMKQIKREVRRSPIAFLGALASKPAMRKVKRKLDYQTIGGAQLLGVNGVCIIAHGRSYAKTVTNALAFADKVLEKEINR